MQRSKFDHVLYDYDIDKHKIFLPNWSEKEQHSAAYGQLISYDKGFISTIKQSKKLLSEMVYQKEKLVTKEKKINNGLYINNMTDGLLCNERHIKGDITTYVKVVSGVERLRKMILKPMLRDGIPKRISYIKMVDLLSPKARYFVEEYRKIVNGLVEENGCKELLVMSFTDKYFNPQEYREIRLLYPEGKYAVEECNIDKKYVKMENIEARGFVIKKRVGIAEPIYNVDYGYEYKRVEIDWKHGQQLLVDYQDYKVLEWVDGEDEGGVPMSIPDIYNQSTNYVTKIVIETEIELQLEEYMLIGKRRNGDYRMGNTNNPQPNQRHFKRSQTPIYTTRIKRYDDLMNYPTMVFSRISNENMYCNNYNNTHPTKAYSRLVNGEMYPHKGGIKTDYMYGYGGHFIYKVPKVDVPHEVLNGIEKLFKKRTKKVRPAADFTRIERLNSISGGMDASTITLDDLSNVSRVSGFVFKNTKRNNELNYKYRRVIDVWCMPNYVNSPEKSNFKLTFEKMDNLHTFNIDGALVITMSDIFNTVKNPKYPKGSHVSLLLIILVLGFTVEEFLLYVPPEIYNIVRNGLFVMIGEDEMISHTFNTDLKYIMRTINRQNYYFITYMSQLDAINILYNRLRKATDYTTIYCSRLPRVTNEDKIKYAIHYLKIHFLPHCVFDDTKESLGAINLRKFLTLATYVTRLLCGDEKDKKYTSRHDFSHKSYDTVGDKQTKFIYNYIYNYSRNTCVGYNTDSTKTAFENLNTCAMTSGNQAKSMKNIGVNSQKTTGGVVIYKATNYLTARLTLRLLKTTRLQSNKTTLDHRHLTTKKMGSLAAFATPEGSNVCMDHFYSVYALPTPPMCGENFTILKNIIEVQATIGETINGIIRGHKHKRHTYVDSFDKWHRSIGTPVYFNNAVVSITYKPILLMHELRKWRRSKFIVDGINRKKLNYKGLWVYGNVNVAIESYHFNLEYPSAIRINNTAGRITTPYIFVDLKNGLKGIEYLDIAELSSLYVRDAKENTLGCMKEFIKNNGTRYPITLHMSTREIVYYVKRGIHNKMIYYPIDCFFNYTYASVKTLALAFNHNISVRSIYSHSLTTGSTDINKHYIYDTYRATQNLCNTSKVLVGTKIPCLNYPGFDDTNACDPIQNYNGNNQKIYKDNLEHCYTKPRQFMTNAVPHVDFTTNVITAFISAPYNSDDCFRVSKDAINRGLFSYEYTRRCTLEENVASKENITEMIDDRDLVESEKRRLKRNIERGIADRREFEMGLDQASSDDFLYMLRSKEEPLQYLRDIARKRRKKYRMGEFIKTKQVIHEKNKTQIRKGVHVESPFLNKTPTIIHQSIHVTSNKKSINQYNAWISTHNEVAEGDKIQYNGQKGTIAVTPQIDMPWTESGMPIALVCDAVSLIKRKNLSVPTIAFLQKVICVQSQLMDPNDPTYHTTTAEKRGYTKKFMADLRTIKTDCTKKYNEKLQHAEEILASHGYNRDGTEDIYSGKTGEPLKAPVLVGVLPMDLLNKISRMVIMNRGCGGPKDRASNGLVKGSGEVQGGAGIKLGPMEMSAILGGRGMDNFHREKEILDGNVIMVICRICRCIGYSKRLADGRQKMFCVNNKEHKDLKIIRVSGKMQQIMYEVMSMNIKLKIDFDD